MRFAFIDFDEEPSMADLVDQIDLDLAAFEAAHGDDIWTYMDQCIEHAGEAFAEHGMGAVSMGWNGSDAANAAVAEGAIYSTANDPTFAEAEALAARWRAKNPVVSDVPADAADFAPRAGALPCPAEDDLPF
jgi:hypothetical protein